MERERLVRKVTTLQVLGGSGYLGLSPPWALRRDEPVTFSNLPACPPLKLLTHPDGLKECWDPRTLTRPPLPPHASAGIGGRAISGRVCSSLAHSFEPPSCRAQRHLSLLSPRAWMIPREISPKTPPCCSDKGFSFPTFSTPGLRPGLLGPTPVPESSS